MSRWLRVQRPETVSFRLAPAERQRSERGRDGAADGRAGQRAVEDPVLLLPLSLHADAELERGPVERSAADVAGAAVAGERSGDVAVLDAEARVDVDVAGRSLDDQAPRSVEWP